MDAWRRVNRRRDGEVHTWWIGEEVDRYKHGGRV